MLGREWAWGVPGTGVVLDGGQGSEGKVTGWRPESALGTRRSRVET